MSPQIACQRGGIFTLVAFISQPIVIMEIFADSIQLTKKGNFCLRHSLSTFVGAPLLPY